jgi:hypothetical protein
VKDARQVLTCGYELWRIVGQSALIYRSVVRPEISVRAEDFMTRCCKAVAEWPSPDARLSALHRTCQVFQDPLAAPLPPHPPVHMPGYRTAEHLGNPCGTKPLTAPARSGR